MNLVIDFGNTFTKLAVFEKNDMIAYFQFDQLTVKQLMEIGIKYPSIKSAIISSVVDYSVEIKHFLEKKYSFFELGSDTPVPIVNKYRSPKTLGKDRIAAVVAASSLYPDQNILVIDAGSCITYDFINDKKEYLGGSISPGLRMRLKAMHAFTKKLPLVDFKKIDYFIGSTTEESILSGAYHGWISEIEGIIGDYRNNYENLTIILSGGDYIYFDKRLKNNIFALPNIVMVGLNIILEFNENKK